MITANNFLKRISPKELTPTNRLIALIFFLINLPGLIATILFPLSIIISFPGMILLYFYYRIFFNSEDIRSTKLTWQGTIYYNIALIAGFTAFSGFHAWPILLFQAFAIAMAGIAYKDLNELEDENELKRKAQREEENEKDAFEEDEYYKSIPELV